MEWYFSLSRWKAIFIILYLLIYIFTTRSRGAIYRAKNISSMKLLGVENDHNTLSENTIMDSEIRATSNYEAMYLPLVTGPVVLFTILTFIISNILLILIFSYLNNISLVKECILGYLYKDVVICLILWNCMRLIRTIACYTINNGLGIDVIYAKVITFVYACIFCLILLFMNIIYVVKCYISITKVLDPPMPWGNNDVLGIRVIRSLCIVFSTGFVTVMYALEMYPKVYYSLIEQNASSANTPEGCYNFLYLNIFFVVTATVTKIVTKVNETASGHIIEAIVPRQMNYFLWIFPTVGIVVMILLQVFELANLLQRISVISSILFVTIPALVIYFADQIKHNATNVLRNKIDEAFLLNIYVTPAIITVILYCTLYIIYTLFDI